jgi:phosphate uptake regulator
MTGGSSYIVTLPKEWIKNLNIQKNDPIGLFKQSNGALLITPKITRESALRTRTFKVEEQTENNYLFRKLIGAYISGYNIVEIKSNQRIKPATRIIIRKFTQTAIGQEVVEETDKSITLKDLLNPAEMPFNRTIKRMHIITKSMHEDAIQSLKNMDKKLAQDIITRDDEVDRLHWLVARQHNIILRNVNFAEKMGTTIDKAEVSFLISRIIERIGDHVIRISKNIIDISEENIDKNIIDKLVKASELSLDLFNKSMSSFFRREIDSANKNIEAVGNLEKLCRDVNTSSLQSNAPIAVGIGNIVDSNRRIGEYAEDISENVINHLVGVENQ